MDNTLRITEIFHSIQGESTFVGRPCVFVRLMGCHLRCRYCDTAYAFHEGESRKIDSIIEEVARYRRGNGGGNGGENGGENGGGNGGGEWGGELGGELGGVVGGVVEITGGEPLLQAGVHELMRRLCDDGYEVLLETSGCCDISECDPRVIRIVDFKTPSSGEVERTIWENVKELRHTDEVKFVIGDREDYQWAREVVSRYELSDRVNAILFSPVHEQAEGGGVTGMKGLEARLLAEWLLEDRIGRARLQLQVHKFIWKAHARGV